MKVQIPEKIGAIFQDPLKTYRGAFGGRGSAKTISFAKMSIVDMIRLEGEPWKFLCGRELQKSLKDSVFSVISSQIEEMRVTEHFDMGREYIRAKNGNEYLFYGLRTNIAEVKGLHGVRRTWLEEAQKVSQSSLNYLIPTVMRDFDDCELWASWNPDEEEDPIQQMYVDHADDSFSVCKINYYDNPWFPESLDKVRLRDLKNNPEQYGWIWEGNFNINNNAAVYGKWIEKAKSEGRIKEGIYDPTLPVFTAWDLGYSDDTAIWWFQVAGNEVRAIDYYENNRQDMRHYAEQLYGREIPEEHIEYGPNGKVLSFKLGKPIEGTEHRIGYQSGDNYVPHDAANKLLQAGGRSVVDQLHEFGIKSRIVEATSQQNQIAAGRGAIDRAWFDPVRCKQGIRCLKKYAFEERDGERGYSTTPKHDVYSHGADGWEILARVWKSAKIDALPPKPRFLNEMTVDEIFYGATPNSGISRI